MKIVHCKKEPYDVYIGRGSKWGNIFTHKRGTLARYMVDTREEAIECYENWIRTQPELMAAIPELVGKTLGCWCAPKRCHGEVLIKLVKEMEKKNEVDSNDDSCSNVGVCTSDSESDGRQE